MRASTETAPVTLPSNPGRKEANVPTDATIHLEPCDIFLTRGTSFVSSSIRFFTRRIGEKRSRVNHVGIIVDAGTLHSAIAVEALSKVRMHAMRRYSKKRATGVAVYRPTNLTDAEKDAIVAKAKTYVDRPYGYMKILAHLADWTLRGAYVFRRFTSDNDYPICSWLVAHAFKAAGKHFDVPAGAANPDDIWDFVQAHTDKYELVRDLRPIPGVTEADG